jgi:hypothetical protein
MLFVFGGCFLKSFNQAVHVGTITLTEKLFKLVSALLDCISGAEHVISRCLDVVTGAGNVLGTV